MQNETTTHKAGYVAIVGEPNVGKSTLLNSILGQKLSIVTNKPQTTRQRVLGIYNEEHAQIVFLDTPGLLQPKYRLHQEMVKHAEMALRDADIILVVTEISHGTELPPQVTDRLFSANQEKPILLVINKVDTIYKPEILPVLDAFLKMNKFKEVIPLSALKNDNIDDLLETLVGYLPEHEPFYPKDILSEQPERFFVAEFIREKIFERYREEIPYSTAVEIREFKEREAGKSFISADIFVERDSQKGILIGKKGEALKEIGQEARVAIEAFIQRAVYLELHVKVRDSWRENEQMLRRFG
ncbi:MAG TPA: GTPase Era, partial [Bacteroidota bacterium]|nr:GTPase Era [Bacteroidota bacterium]